MRWPHDTFFCAAATRFLGQFGNARQPELPAGTSHSATSPQDRTEAGLESVKKTHQVAPVGVGSGACPAPFQQQQNDINPTSAYPDLI
jgi:hypothetical protein